MGMEQLPQKGFDDMNFEEQVADVSRRSVDDKEPTKVETNEELIARLRKDLVKKRPQKTLDKIKKEEKGKPSKIERDHFMD
jgi:hypothetical protein